MGMGALQNGHIDSRALLPSETSCYHAHGLWSIPALQRAPAGINAIVAIALYTAAWIQPCIQEDSIRMQLTEDCLS